MRTVLALAVALLLPFPARALNMHCPERDFACRLDDIEKRLDGIDRDFDLMRRHQAHSDEIADRWETLLEREIAVTGWLMDSENARRMGMPPPDLPDELR